MSLKLLKAAQFYVYMITTTTFFIFEIIFTSRNLKYNNKYSSHKHSVLFKISVYFSKEKKEKKRLSVQILWLKISVPIRFWYTYNRIVCIKYKGSPPYILTPTKYDKSFKRRPVCLAGCDILYSVSCFITG